MGHSETKFKTNCPELNHQNNETQDNAYNDVLYFTGNSIAALIFISFHGRMCKFKKELRSSDLEKIIWD